MVFIEHDFNTLCQSKTISSLLIQTFLKATRSVKNLNCLKSCAWTPEIPSQMIKTLHQEELRKEIAFPNGHPLLVSFVFSRASITNSGVSFKGKYFSPLFVDSKLSGSLNMQREEEDDKATERRWNCHLETWVIRLVISAALSKLPALFLFMTSFNCSREPKFPPPTQFKLKIYCTTKEPCNLWLSRLIKQTFFLFPGEAVSKM